MRHSDESRHGPLGLPPTTGRLPPGTAGWMRRSGTALPTTSRATVQTSTRHEVCRAEPALSSLFPERCPGPGGCILFRHSDVNGSVSVDGGSAESGTPEAMRRRRGPHIKINGVKINIGGVTDGWAWPVDGVRAGRQPHATRGVHGQHAGMRRRGSQPMPAARSAFRQRNPPRGVDGEIAQVVRRGLRRGETVRAPSELNFGAPIMHIMSTHREVGRSSAARRSSR
jgi:hypothetical protein